MDARTRDLAALAPQDPGAPSCLKRDRALAQSDQGCRSPRHQRQDAAPCRRKRRDQGVASAPRRSLDLQQCRARRTCRANPRRTCPPGRQTPRKTASGSGRSILFNGIDRWVLRCGIVVSTPSLAFSAHLVDAEEPVRVQALGAELAVQAFDEGIVGRFAGPAEVERNAAHEGPQIKLLANEFRPVIEPDRLWAAKRSANPFERVDDIATAKILSYLDCR